MVLISPTLPRVFDKLIIYAGHARELGGSVVEQRRGSRLAVSSACSTNRVPSSHVLQVSFQRLILVCISNVLCQGLYHRLASVHPRRRIC